MLPTLGRVWDGVGIMEEGENAGMLVGMGAAGEHGGWGGAGVIPSISPTCSGTAVEPSSARSLAAGVVHWCARLRIVCAGRAGWPWCAMNRGGVGADANWIGGSWARGDDLPVVV
jgi:hypothetical protein